MIIIANLEICIQCDDNILLFPIFYRTTPIPVGLDVMWAIFVIKMFELPLFIFPIWWKLREATAQTSFNQSSHLNQYCLQHTVQLLIRLFIPFILFFADSYACFICCSRFWLSLFKSVNVYCLLIKWHGNIM